MKTAVGKFDTMIRFLEKNGALIFRIRVVPRASKTEIVGEFGGDLKIRITAPPVDGAANAEVIKLLAKTFGVGKSDVEIIGGETSKTKQIRLLNLSIENFREIVKC